MKRDRKPWYRNAGKGDNIGTRVNLNADRPKYHLPGDNYISTGLALCGRKLNPGFVSDDPPTGHRCERCAAKHRKENEQEKTD